MKSRMANFQLGKYGLTDNTIKLVRDAFNTHQNVRISVLKSLTRDKEEARKIAEQLCQQLGKRYTYRLIGYTILVKQWRKPRS